MSYVPDNGTAKRKKGRVEVSEALPGFLREKRREKQKGEREGRAGQGEWEKGSHGEREGIIKLAW